MTWRASLAYSWLGNSFLFIVYINQASLPYEGVGDWRSWTIFSPVECSYRLVLFWILHNMTYNVSYQFSFAQYYLYLSYFLLSYFGLLMQLVLLIVLNDALRRFLDICQPFNDYFLLKGHFYLLKIFFLIVEFLYFLFWIVNIFLKLPFFFIFYTFWGV